MDNDLPSVDSVMANDLRVLRQWQVSSFIGKLLTLIETLGLSPSQEKAFKSIVKQETWLFWNDNVLYDELRTKIDKLIEEESYKQFENVKR